MRHSTVQKAVAAAIALGAGATAGAWDLSGGTQANILYVSGSTAIDGALLAYAINSTDLICDASQGSIDEYVSTQAGVKFTAVACVGGTGSNESGTQIAFIKEDNAGSLNGITPVNTGLAIAYPTLSSLSVANCPTKAGSPNGLEQAFTIHTCGSSITSTTVQPNLGFADVEAAIFAAPAGNLTVFKSVDVDFAPAVSLGLYHALQSAQGLTVNAEDNADTPSLPRPVLAGIYEGLIATWTKIIGTNGAVSSQTVQFGNSGQNASSQNQCWDGTAFSTAADCQSGTLGPSEAPSSSTIYICERGQSSGTQQTSQIFYSNRGCASNTQAFSLPVKPGTSCAADGCSWSNTTYGTVTVFAGNGTGDVLSCLVGHDEQGQLAIGYASTDNGWGTFQSTSTRKDFRFIKVDNVAPSIENIADGTYDYWAQSAGYFPSSTSASNYPAGTALTLMTAFSSGAHAIGTAASIGALDASFEYAGFFDGGLLNIPGNGGSTPHAATDTLAQFEASPVNSFARLVTTNQCQHTSIPASTTPSFSNSPTWKAP
jgi:hypothetical protein